MQHERIECMKKKVLGLTTALIRQYINHWKPFSRLFLLCDSPVWSIAHDMNELRSVCRSLNIRTLKAGFAAAISNKQCIFVGSHFELLIENNRWLQSTGNRLATAYFHGKPGLGVDEFDICYENLARYHHLISRIQVSCSEMRDIILESGISSEKVFHIPIGINLSFFSQQTAFSKKTMRRELEIPENAVVVGSFQKDGEGWGDGMNPKLIKGPDIFLKTVEILKQSVPELYILLSGPARGYVKSGLNRLKIPYKHVYQESYSDIGRMFQALDLYIVASREEGGPKAVLESMASGVPLVTTRVGQAMDLVEHGRNGWMVPPDDHKGLAHWSTYALEHTTSIRPVIQTARETAEKNSYTSQIPLWLDFMKGFVEIK